tara:strand:- start:190 stop:447 length:258 start_codon:yes stop_codon:yes gene_type:complete
MEEYNANKDYIKSDATTEKRNYSCYLRSLSLEGLFTIGSKLLDRHSREVTSDKDDKSKIWLERYTVNSFISLLCVVKFGDDDLDY